LIFERSISASVKLTKRDRSAVAAAGMLVFVVFLQMGSKLVDSTRKYGYLHLRRAGVGLVAGYLLYCVLLLSLCQHGRSIA
jgi:hypothetical protein